MVQDPHKEHAEVARDQSKPEMLSTWARRIGLIVVALPFGLLAAWMFWIGHISLDGNGWYDLIVGHILEELILAVALFALVLLLGGAFAPSWFSRAYTVALRHLNHSIAFVRLLFAAALFIVLILAILAGWGILK